MLGCGLDGEEVDWVEDMADGVVEEDSERLSG